MWSAKMQQRPQLQVLQKTSSLPLILLPATMWSSEIATATYLAEVPVPESSGVFPFSNTRSPAWCLPFQQQHWEEGYIYVPTFFNFLSFRSHSINSNGIRLLSSHSGKKARNLQLLIFRSYIRYILHVLWYSTSVAFFKFCASTFLNLWFG